MVSEQVEETNSQDSVFKDGQWATDGKHPDWRSYPEFYWDGSKYEYYFGTPGAYDPNVYVVVDYEPLKTPGEYISADAVARDALSKGVLKQKKFVIDTESAPGSENYGQYVKPYEISGGTGAKVFLTSQDVPSCTERGRAKESLGLPDRVDEINVPEFLAAAMNDALTGAGYRPDEIAFTPKMIGDVGVIDLDTQYPGVEFTSPTPGILPKLGIPEGDFAIPVLCVEAELDIAPTEISSYNSVTQELTSEEKAIADLEAQKLIESGAFGYFDANNPAPFELTGGLNEAFYGQDDFGVLTLACVTSVGTMPVSPPPEGPPPPPPPACIVVDPTTGECHEPPVNIRPEGHGGGEGQRIQPNIDIGQR